MASNQQPQAKSSKEPRQQKTSPQRREISSGIIVFRKLPQGPAYLLLCRAFNQWTFPRGKIEQEERSFAAALRETREETGLGRNDLRFIDYFKAYENWTFVKNGEKIHKTVILYLAETRKRQVRLEREFEGFGWFGYDMAMKIFAGSKNDENRKILDLVHDFLQKHYKRNLTKQQQEERERS
jgi:bis(5'-nucleosidyl)-tetraphosphatase